MNPQRIGLHGSPDPIVSTFRRTVIVRIYVSSDGSPVSGGPGVVEHEWQTESGRPTGSAAHGLLAVQSIAARPDTLMAFMASATAWR